MKVKFMKVHPDAVIPTRAHPGDAGYDLVSIEDTIIPPMSCRFVPVGLRIDMPKEEPLYYATIETRSSYAKKGLLCHRGILDNEYTGDISPLMFNWRMSENVTIQKGSKVAQLVFHRMETPEVEETKEIVEKDRGEKGFGSTGK